MSADISKTYDEYCRVGERRDLPGVTPDMMVLHIPVKLQVFDQCKSHREQMLCNCFGIRSGRVGEQGILMQNTGNDIGVRARGVQLHEFQDGGLADQRCRYIAYDDL